MSWSEKFVLKISFFPLRAGKLFAVHFSFENFSVVVEKKLFQETGEEKFQRGAVREINLVWKK